MNPLVAPEPHAAAGRTALSVNVNKIALLRNTRHLGIPDPLALARIAIDAGADGITVHPRPDGRHVRAADVQTLGALVRSRPGVEFNIEGNPTQNLMDFVHAQRPDQCTFVPDAEGQFTSDHGWSLPAEIDRLKPLIAQAQALGVRVSLFMDPQPEAMAHAAAAGADRVELYTESWASAFGTPSEAEVRARFCAAAAAARAAGLGVNAGHDLNRANLGAFLAAVPDVCEVSIGHALIADALELGMAETVRAYQRCIRSAGMSGGALAR